MHPECVADLDKQIDYIGSIDLMVYFGEGKLHARSFGDDSISQKSTLKNTQVSETSPSWINSLLERTTLSDETQLI